MITGKVIGQIYSTINHPFYDGKKMLVVEKTDEHGKPLNDYEIAIDTVDAGIGDPVLLLSEGTGARQIFNDAKAPVRSVIVGIVDVVAV